MVPFGTSYFTMILGNDFQASVAGLVWIICKVHSSPESHAHHPISGLPSSEGPAWKAERSGRNPEVPQPWTTSGLQVLMVEGRLRAHVVSTMLLPCVPETTELVFSFLKLLSSSSGLASYSPQPQPGHCLSPQVKCQWGHSEACPLYNTGLCTCMAAVVMLVVRAYVLKSCRPQNVCVAFE